VTALMRAEHERTNLEHGGTRLASNTSRVRAERPFAAGLSVVAGDDPGSLICLTAIPQDDRAKGRDGRCDREERGQRARFQLTDTGRRQRLGAPTATAFSVSTGTGARCPATASNAITTATAIAAGTASAASTAGMAPSAACSTPAATASGWSNDPRRCLWCQWGVILTRS
jgi:hypothetical protein